MQPSVGLRRRFFVRAGGQSAKGYIGAISIACKFAGNHNLRICDARIAHSRANYIQPHLLTFSFSALLRISTPSLLRGKESDAVKNTKADTISSPRLFMPHPHEPA
jgi:hypothetical protein